MSSPSSRPHLLHASGFRLAAFYSALLTLAFAATAVIVGFSATAAAENALRQKLELEVDALVHELEVEGADAVRAAIVARMERPGAPEYWLSDASGQPLAGDLPAMQGADGWHFVELADDAVVDGLKGAEELMVLTRRLANGMSLSVGADVSEGRQIIGMTIGILARAGALSVVLVLFVGILVTRNGLRRMDAISTALESAGSGNLQARIPVRRQFFLADLQRVSVALNRMLERNESLVGGLRRVSRDVAHDLRTPLTHLLQQLEQASAVEGSSRKDAIAAAQGKAAQIIKTFDAILRLAEIEAGTARTRFVSVDLKGIAETLVDAYGPDVEQSGKTLTVLAPRTVQVEGDRELLVQAAANLVENALRHTPEGTAISIVVTPAPRPAIAVVDSGEGIPAAELPAVVEPFHRCDPSRTTAGSGLGLSIVKAIADLHDAELHLETFAGGFRAAIRFTAVG